MQKPRRNSGDRNVRFGLKTQFAKSPTRITGVPFFSEDFANGDVRALLNGNGAKHRHKTLRITFSPVMEEMSPYRRGHAPHVVGYFETGETRFRLLPLAGGGTRLTVTAKHRLRIDPVPYWGPIARWGIADNVDRVLQDVRLKTLDVAR